VGDRGALEGHLDQVLLRRIDTLADGVRNFPGLAHPGPDAALAVADHDHGAEGEATSALDHLRDAVDLDDPLLELVRILVFVATAGSAIAARSAVVPRSGVTASLQVDTLIHWPGAVRPA